MPQVKIDRKSFAHGAMRECFRMKKLSNFSNSTEWARDSNNYVAKRYMDPTDRDIHFQVGWKIELQEALLDVHCPGRQAADGCQALGGGVQQAQSSEEGFD